MKRKILAFIIIILFSLQTIPAQEVTLPQLEELVISVRLNRADIFFPKQFGNYYNEVQKLIFVSAQRPLTNTEQSDISDLYRLFSQLNRKAESLRPFLSGVLEARDDALYNNADEFALSLFREAEERLHKLAEKISESNAGNWQPSIREVIVRYREAEYEAVKNKLLSEVRILIQESKALGAEKTAPMTYRKVESMLKEVEKILSSQQYDDPTLGAKANELLEESRHLLYISQLSRQIRRDDAAFENYLLQLEQVIGKLASLVEVPSEFSRKVEEVLGDIELSVANLKRELEQQKKQNIILLDSLEDMQAEIAALKSRVGKNESILQKVDNLKSSLSPVNVKTIYQKDRIVLRLNGIEFPLGKIQINATDRKRLEKIGQALHNFPDKQIRVQLGQSATGNVQYSKSLANQRARAVTLILQSAGFIPDSRISAEGVLLQQANPPAHAIVDVIIQL